jgi:SAM-dependent methyltransferase
MSADQTSTQTASSTVGAPDEWLAEHPIGAFIRHFAEMEASEANIIDLLVAAAGIKPGMTVLDVGSGAGIPALRLAEIVGPKGKVVATDPSALSIEAITKHARERGLKNVEPVRASAAGLPFPAQSFDAVTCSFGVMFFTDVQAGLTRIREVLRPGGRAAFVAWGSPEENALFGPFRSTTAPYLPEPPQPPEPDSPHPMRFAAPGSLSAALSAAGYRDIREDTPPVEMVWNGPPQTVIDIMLDVSRIEEAVPPDRHDAMRADLHNAYKQFTSGDETRLPVRVVIASGTA